MAAIVRPKIRIFSVEARGLRAVDRSGSDPYIRFQVGSVKHKSKYIKNNLSPVWDDVDFILGGYELDLNEHNVLHVCVKDHDLIGKNRTIGECEVDLAGMFYPHLCATRVYPR